MLVLIVITIAFGLIPESLSHDRPVIGVLVQEISKVFDVLYPNQYDLFVPASYVQWIQSGGARVIPIWSGKSRDYYQNIMSKINGILLPGGNVNKTKRGGYAEAAEIIINHAIQLNKRKDVFPVFGIGLGMDFLLYLSNNKRDVSVECNMDSLAAPLILSKTGSKQTAMYNSSSDHIKRMMTKHPISVLNTKKCYTKKVFDDSPLSKHWIPFSLNSDMNNRVIVSAIEHQTLPFYATLFHCEKVSYEWAESTHIPHTLATVEVAQFFSNYFVNEARKSEHKFSNKNELLGLTIENFSPVFTAKDGSNYFQTYLFKKM